VFAGAPMSYTNWAPGQPDNRCPIFCRHTDCAILRTGQNYKWMDYPCSSSKYHYYFICEYGELCFV